MYPARHKTAWGARGGGESGGSAPSCLYLDNAHNSHVARNTQCKLKLHEQYLKLEI